MTERELADKFTPPSDVLKRVREILVRDFEQQIVNCNVVIKEYPGTDAARNALVKRETWGRAALSVRALIDLDGKVLKEDIDL